MVTNYFEGLNDLIITLGQWSNDHVNIIRQLGQINSCAQ